jgi:hypothetical protein
MTRRALALAVAALVLLGAGCGSGERASERAAQPGTTTATAPSTQLTDLRDISQVRSLFNSRSGEPRLILLVSPT